MKIFLGGENFDSKNNLVQHYFANKVFNIICKLYKYFINKKNKSHRLKYFEYFH